MKHTRYSTRPNIADFMGSVIKDEFIRPLNKMMHNHTLPMVNIKEIESAYHIDVAAPGLVKSNFSIEIEKDQLKVSYKEKEETNESRDPNLYSQEEFNYQSFTRLFNLPKLAAKGKIEAKYEDGLLKIVVPKEEIQKDEPTIIVVK